MTLPNEPLVSQASGSSSNNSAAEQFTVVQLEAIIREQHQQLNQYRRWLAEVTYQRDSLRHSRFGQAHRFYVRTKNRLLRWLKRPTIQLDTFPDAIYSSVPPSPLDHPSSMAGSTQHQTPESASLLEVVDGQVQRLFPPTGTQYDVLYFSTIEWSHLTQRPQQLMRQFAAHGHRVFWIDVQLKSEADNILDRASALPELEPDIYHVRLPGFGLIYTTDLTPPTLTAMQESFDWLRLTYAIDCAVSIVNFPGWSPLVLWLRSEFGWKVVYDCLDDQSEFRRLHRFKTIDHEPELIRECDVLAVTSQPLYDANTALHHNPVLIKNGADYDRFSTATSRGLLDHLQPPIIGFFGTLADWLDLDLIDNAARSYPDWSFVFIGRLDFAQASNLRQFEAIQSRSNVHYLGQVAFDDLPVYLSQFTVCTVPFQDLPITRAMNVVKVYEYLAAGKPVVAQDLPELQAFAADKVIQVYHTPAEYLNLLAEAIALTASAEEVAARRKVAEMNTWADRYEQLIRAIEVCHEQVVIIILTFDNLSLTQLCIESILSRTRWPKFRIVIVDNGSKPDMIAYLQQIERRHASISVIYNSTNLGFARANNIALERFMEEGDYFALLNDDTIVTTGWLPRLLRHLRKPDVGLVGPVTNFTSNEAKIPVGYQAVSEMNTWALWYMRRHDGEIVDMRMLSAYCWVLSRETLRRVGLLDERFYVGMFEDDDYCHRIDLIHERIICCRDVFVHHFGRSSFQKMPDAEYQAIFDAHRTLYENKWKMAWNPLRSKSSRIVKKGYPDGD